VINPQGGEYFIQPNNPNQHQPIPLEKELVTHAEANVGDMLRVNNNFCISFVGHRLNNMRRRKFFTSRIAVYCDT
jgi:exoribonuclease R